MKVKLLGVRRIHINSEYVKLDALLKLSSVTSTGGQAKILIQSGEVFVDGEVCTLRGKKIRPGSVVRYESDTLLVSKAK